MSPGSLDETPYDDDYLGEAHPEVDDLLTSLSAPHDLLMGVLPRASAFDHPPFGGRYGSWYALFRDFGSQAVSNEGLSFEVAMRVLRGLLKSERLAAVTVTEFNPDHGEVDGSTTEALADGLVHALTGSAVLES